MSREPLAQERDWWADLAERAGEGFQTFRAGKLYPQVMLTLVLVGVSGLVTLYPVGPLGNIHKALTWTATHEYDFAGQAVAVRGWADERGGWKAAMMGTLDSGVARVRQWAAPLFPPPDDEPAVGEVPAAGVEPVQEGPEKPALPVVTGTWIMPVDGSVMNAFGWLAPHVQMKFHSGVDILALRGAQVVAVADGVVTRVAKDEQLGHRVEVEHGDLLVLYAQLAAVKVKDGDRLRQGAHIGDVGNPVGEHRHLSPHLHFEVRPKGTENAVNPIPYLPLGGKEI